MRQISFVLFLVLFFFNSFGQKALPFYNGNKWGVMDTLGNVLMPAECAKIDVNTHANILTAQKERKYGAVNELGEWVVDPKYRGLRVMSDRFVRVLQDTVWEVFDFAKEKNEGDKSKVITSLELGNELQFFFQANDKAKVVNKKTGKSHEIDAKFVKRVLRFTNMTVIVFVDASGRYGILDDKGNVLVKASMQNFQPIMPSEKSRYLYFWNSKVDTSTFYFPFKKYYYREGSLNGIRTITNQEILKPIYRRIDLGPEFYVADNGITKTVFSPEGKKIFAGEYSYINHIDSTFFEYSEESPLRRGIIRIDGRKLVPPKYHSVSLHGSKKFFLVRDGRRWGVYNIRGQELLFPEFPLKNIQVLPEGNKIKALKVSKKDTSMVIVMLDKRGELLDRLNFKNFTQVKFEDDPGANYWYQDTMRKSETYKLWGVKAASGKVLISNMYSGYRKIKKLSNMYLVFREKEFVNAKKRKFSHTYYGLVNLHKGLQVLPAKQRRIFLEDLDSANFFRAFSSERKYSMMNAEGKVIYKNCAFIERPIKNFVRIAIGGGLSTKHSEKYGIWTPGKLTDLVLWSSFKNPGKLSVYGSKWGLLNLEGNAVIKPTYDFLQRPFRNRIIAQKHKYWGILSMVGSTLVDFSYEHIKHFFNETNHNKWAECDFYMAKKHGKWGVIDKKGHEILPFEYSDIKYLPNKHGQFFAVEKHRQWGVVDAKQKQIVPHKYFYISYLSDKIHEYFKAEIPARTHGYLNKKYEQILLSETEKHIDYNDGYFLIRDKNRKYWMLDTLGQRVHEHGFPIARKPGENRLWVSSSYDDFAAITTTNDTIARGYINAKWFNEGLAPVRVLKHTKFLFFESKKRLWGYVDSLGNEVIKPKWKDAEPFTKNGFAIVQSDNGFGLIDRNGKTVLSAKYKDITEFDANGIARVMDNNREWGFFHKSGKWIMSPKYKTLGAYSEGLAYFKDKKRRYGYVDLEGKVKIKPTFWEAKNFSESYAPAQIRGKWGLIDKTGKWYLGNKFKKVSQVRDSMFYTLQNTSNGIVERWFYKDLTRTYPIIRGVPLWPNDFVNDLAFYQYNGTCRFVNSKGKSAFPGYFRTIKRLDDETFLVKNEMDFKMGILNHNGSYNHLVMFDYLKELGDGFYYFTLNSAYEVLDTKGENITGESYFTINDHDKFVQLRNLKRADYVLKSGRLIEPMELLAGK